MSQTKTTLVDAQILIATYRGDFQFLGPCLRSLQKHAVNFCAPPVLAVASEDLEGARQVAQQNYPEAKVFVHDIPHRYANLRTVAGGGMQRAQSAMLHGDLICPEAGVIFLLGSDCLAVSRFDAADFLTLHGAPVVLMNSYGHLAKHHNPACDWRDGTARILGHDVTFEYMRRLPSVFHHDAYLGLRKYIENLHGVPFLDYWYGSFAAGQRGHSEANLLGAYSHRFLPASTKFINLDDTAIKSPGSLLQLWSHGGLEHVHDSDFILPDGTNAKGQTAGQLIQKYAPR